jgi:23S rRNA U2552 (ribose-2'-O)-methylase RlmE/FtsJ|tara:strand:- start:954 stop:1574 length:621 start_codon:yes stop_codon:yes gene_type:complete
MSIKPLFDKYGCDKSKKHNYETVYDIYFEPLRDKKINILEIGVYKGASSQALLDYFPKATLYGVDIFTRKEMSSLEIYDNNRVHLLQSDSTDTSTSKKMSEEWTDVKFDIIIDDGAHWPKANQDTFNVTFEFLKSNGVYFIEDVWPLHKMSEDEFKHPWIMKHQERYNIFKHFDFMDCINENTVKHHDCRKLSGEPDSYILAVKRS